MDWATYELEVLEELRRAYPDHSIRRNVKLRGFQSKRDRQIDILIEHNIADSRFKICVDTKNHSRKIDVKTVESFIGLRNDIRAHKGILVSPQGFTEAAIARAFNDESDVDLDIFGLEGFSHLQGGVGIPYAGNYGVFVQAPFGWVIDAAQRGGSPAFLYQRGMNFDSAAENKEFIYLNFWELDCDKSSIDMLSRRQFDDLRLGFPEIIYLIEDGPKGFGKNARIRHIAGLPWGEEYTGFVEFDKFIAFFVLLTRPELSERNLRKLRYLMRTIIPIQIRRSEIIR